MKRIKEVLTHCPYCGWKLIKDGYCPCAELPNPLDPFDPLDEPLDPDQHPVLRPSGGNGSNTDCAFVNKPERRTP